MNARATSFATLKDLRAYISCLLGGRGAKYCYRYGDNGQGAWGAVTAQLQIPMVALPSGIALRGRGVMVKLIGAGHGNPFAAICADIGPAGVIDLNPAALILAGLPSDTELDCAAEWSYIQPVSKPGSKRRVKGKR